MKPLEKRSLNQSVQLQSKDCSKAKEYKQTKNQEYDRRQR